jgi:translation elongation factor EF-4
LAGSQGALLLVDANNGVQAQTLNHYLTAFAADKVILPILNKIDLLSRTGDSESLLAAAETDMRSQLDLELDTEISKISAKTGFGVSDLLERIITEIPPPDNYDPEKPCRLHVFDSWYDDFRGTIMLVYCDNGTFKKGDWIVSYRQENRSFEILDVGILYGPVVSFPLPQIRTRQVAYLYLNVKDDAVNFLGDTFFKRDQVATVTKTVALTRQWKESVEPLPLLPASRPSVYAGFYPAEASELDMLQKALKRICLTDASVSIEQESSDSLGIGWRLGFLGSLHMDVFRQRLQQQICSGGKYNNNINISIL